MDDLTKVFVDIKKNHKAYALQRIIKNCVGPSTLRTLAPNSKQDIIECLSEVKFESIKKLQSEEEFSKWFAENAKLIGKRLKNKNGTTKTTGSLIWGYGTKILALYMRDLFSCNQLVTSKDAKKFTPWLYCPIDRIILKHMGKHSSTTENITGILNIDTSAKFFTIQGHLMKHATLAKTNRIYFDDKWAAE